MYNIWTPTLNRVVLHDYWAVDVQISHTFQVNAYLDALYDEQHEMDPETSCTGLGRPRSRSVFDTPDTHFALCRILPQTLRWDAIFATLSVPGHTE